MNYKMMGRFNSLILTVEAVFMVPALLISMFCRDNKGVIGFSVAILVAAGIAGLLALLARGASPDFFAKEGLVCVGLSWIVMSLIGSLPFYVSGYIPSFIDALFETVSGFTTTGASILSDVTALSNGMLYWRSFSHWLGGMGVLVFLLAIIPVSGKSEGYTMHILRAESPGPDVGKLVPKMRQTAAILYSVYVALTVLNFIFLVAGKMPVFDAVCTAFGTAGTGGFGIKPDGLASYTPYLQVVTTVFMLLFGINFSCYYLILLRQVKSVLKDEEIRLYIGVVVTAILLITANIYKMYSSVGEAVRHAAFQVSSIITTTGFATTDFNSWPEFSKSILLVLMFIGACAGSTGGGIKCARVLLIFKTIKRNIGQVLQPKRVKVIRVNGKMMDERLVASTNAYLAVYIIIMIASFILVSLDGLSMTANVSAVISCVNNIGPGFAEVGPMFSYGSYGVLSKCVLIFDMLAGRLEIFPILVLFNRHAWKRQG